VVDDDEEEEGDEEEDEEDEEEDVAVDGVFDFGVECACNGFVVVALWLRFGVAIAVIATFASFPISISL
jgi:hypothetical protein